MARNHLGITDAGRVEVSRWRFPHITRKTLLITSIVVCLAISFSLLGLSQTLWHTSTPNINVEPPKDYPIIPASTPTTTSTPNPNPTPLPKITTKWETMENGGGTNFVFLDKTGETIVAGGYGEILRTEDGGKTWVSVTNQGGGDLVFDSATQTLYAYSTKGILKSADGGKTWQLTNSAGLGQLSVRFLQKDNTGSYREFGYHIGAGPLAIDKDGNLLVGAPEGIFKSQNGGQTWSQIGPRLSNERLIVKEGVKYILFPQFSQDSQMWFDLPEGFTFVENSFDPPWNQIKTYRDWKKWLQEEWGDKIPQIQEDAVEEQRQWTNSLPVNPTACGGIFARDVNNADIIIGALLPQGTAEAAEEIRLGKRKTTDPRPLAKDIMFFLSLDGGKLWREMNPPPPIDGKNLDGSYGRPSAGTPYFGLISTDNYLKIFVSGVTGDKVPPAWRTTVLIK